MADWIKDGIKDYGAKRKAEALQGVKDDFNNRVGYTPGNPPPTPFVREAYVTNDYVEPELAPQVPQMDMSRDVDKYGIYGAQWRQNMVDGGMNSIYPVGKAPGTSGSGGDGGGSGGGGSATSRNVDRGGAKGTQTSPPPAKPADFDAFSQMLGSKYGIQIRAPFESNSLPGTQEQPQQSPTQGMGPLADGAAYGAFLDATKGTKGVGPLADGAAYASMLTQSPTQGGTSAAPDVSDQSRAVPVESPARKSPVMGVNGHVFGGEEPDDATLTSPGFSARSRAFLDYDGPGGSAMALRAAEASQGYIRQNGKNVALTGRGEDGKGQWTEFSDEGRRALVKDGNAVASQEFLNDYLMNKEAPTPKAGENPTAQNPVPASNAQGNYGPLADGDKYGAYLDATEGTSGMGPLANGEVYGNYLANNNNDDYDYKANWTKDNGGYKAPADSVKNYNFGDDDRFKKAQDDFNSYFGSNN